MNSKNPKNPGSNKEQSIEALNADIINANQKTSILNKISRKFFNNYLSPKLNKILKQSGRHLYFPKFPANIEKKFKDQ